MRVIIAGPRDLNPSKETIATAALSSGFTPTAIITGGANGVDRAAYKFAREYGHQTIELVPLWDKYGKRAGPIRNMFMAQIGEALIVIKREGEDTRGTKNMIEKAEKAGLPTYIYEI